jgi:hypothetical protein
MKSRRKYPSEKQFFPKPNDGLEWRQIPGWPKYEAARCGKFRVIETGRPVAVVLQHTGYLSVWLSRERGVRGQYLRVHRVLWMAFVGPLRDDELLNHIDGNKLNNDVSNLEIVTCKQNMEHASRLGLMTRGERNHFAKLTAAQVLDIKLRLRCGEKQRDIAAAYGVDVTCIGHISRGKNWRHVTLLPLAEEAEAPASAQSRQAVG